MQERGLVYLIKLARSLQGIVLEQHPDRGAQKLAFLIPYRDRGHLIAAVLSSRRWPASPAIVQRYLLRLERWAESITAPCHVDTYTFLAVFYKVTRPVWSIGRRSYIVLDYKNIERIRDLLARLYERRCAKAVDGYKSVFCSIADALKGRGIVQ